MMKQTGGPSNMKVVYRRVLDKKATEMRGGDPRQRWRNLDMGSECDVQKSL